MKDIGQLKIVYTLIEKLIVEHRYGIKKIYLNTAQDLFSSDDNKLKPLRSFDGINNYFTITFDNWDEFSIGDYTKYQIDSENDSNRIIEDINDIITDIHFSLEELNNFIELICDEYGIPFNK